MRIHRFIVWLTLAATTWVACDGGSDDSMFMGGDAADAAAASDGPEENPFSLVDTGSDVSVDSPPGD